MARFTTDCRRPGQPEISIDVDLNEIPQRPVDHLVQTIEEMIRSGVAIGDEHTIQLGWSLLRVTREQDGSLSLYEPDGASVPMQFKRGITESVRQMLVQLWHVDSYGLERDTIALPSVLHSVIACRHLDLGEGAFLARSAPADAYDSGWFVGCHDVHHNHSEVANLTRISLYEAFLKKPRIAPWIAFPVTTTVLLAPGEHPKVTVGDQQIELVPGSFVDQALHESVKVSP